MCPTRRKEEAGPQSMMASGGRAGNCSRVRLHLTGSLSVAGVYMVYAIEENCTGCEKKREFE